jgi:hypothetical protein
VNGPALRAGLRRAGLVAGGFTLAALAIERIPAGSPVRAAAMLLLPCLLLRVLRREERRLAQAADRLRPTPLRRRAPAPPARPPP